MSGRSRDSESPTPWPLRRYLRVPVFILQQHKAVMGPAVKDSENPITATSVGDCTTCLPSALVESRP